MSAVIENLDGLLFKKGFLFGTREGGTADVIGFGALQNIELAYSTSTVEISGPEAFTPLGVGLTGETLTGSAEFAVFTPNQLEMALGGSTDYDAGNDVTTYTKLTTQEPGPFNLRLKTPSDGSEMELVLYRCLCTGFGVLRGGANREFNVSNFDFRVYGQAIDDGAKLFDIILPGDLTQSS